MSRLSLGITSAFLIAASLSGCGLFEKPKEKPLEGERVAIPLAPSPKMSLQRVKEGEIRLPPIELLQDWPQADVNAQHAAPNVSLGSSLVLSWKASVGHGGSITGPLVTEPVLGGGRVYTLDARFHITALDLQTGERVWEVDVSHPEENTEGWGGGVSLCWDKSFCDNGGRPSHCA